MPSLNVRLYQLAYTLKTNNLVMYSFTFLVNILALHVNII